MFITLPVVLYKMAVSTVIVFLPNPIDMFKATCDLQLMEYKLKRTLWNPVAEGNGPLTLILSSQSFILPKALVWISWPL